MSRTIAIGAALLLLGAAGCVSSSKYEMKAKEAVANDTRAKEATARADACEAKVGEMQKELAAAAEAKTALQAQAASAEAKSAQYEQLAGSLQKPIQAGQIEVSELRGKMTVKLKDKILFPSGSAKLTRDGAAALDVVAGVFKDMKGKNVIVAGYTDDLRVSAKGPYKDNWDLSAARAISVVRYLASKGVPPVMLGAAGFSEFRPVAANDSPANRSLNRRIEIALTAADYQMPEVEAK
jgi:chemotaxis protein MotB